MIVCSVTTKTLSVFDFTFQNPILKKRLPLAYMFSILIVADFFNVTILIVCLPLSFAIPSIQNSFHAFLTALKKVFPHSIVSTLKKNAPHLQRSGLIEKFPYSRSLIISELTT